MPHKFAFPTVASPTELVMTSGAASHNSAAGAISVGRLAHSSVLDISIYERFGELNSQFKAQCNLRQSLALPFYIVVTAITMIQVVGPSLCLACEEIWPTDSPFTSFLGIIGFLWEGLTGEYAIVSAILFNVLNLCIPAAEIPLLIYFHKARLLQPWHRRFVLVVVKFVRPLCAAAQVASFPKVLVEKNAALIVLEIINTVVFFCDHPLISARVLMENMMRHEWYYIQPVLESAFLQLVVFLSSFAGLYTSIARPVLLGCTAAVYFAYGVYLFWSSPYVKRGTSVLFAALSLSGGCVAVIGLVLSLLDSSSAVLLVVGMPVFIVIFWIVLRMIDKKNVAKVLSFFDSLEARPEELEDLLHDRWKKPRHAIRDVRLAFEHWPPALLSWKPTTWSLQQWPDDVELNIMWCRIVAMFPKDDEIYRMLVGRYAKLPDHRMRTVYVHQLFHIGSSRITSTTPEVEKKLQSMKRAAVRIRGLQCRLWKNILQRSLASFWSDVKGIFGAADDLEALYLPLLEQSPNDLNVAIAYCNFVLHTQADFNGYLKLLPEVQKLRDNGIVHEDFAVAAARNFLPELQHICGESTQADGESSPQRRPTPELELEVDHLKTSLQTLIDNSRVGRLSWGWVILVLGTIVTIVGFSLYCTAFQNDFIGDFRARAHFLESSQRATMRVNDVIMGVTFVPFIHLPKFAHIKLGKTGPEVATSDTRLMKELLAPNLYAELEPFDYDVPSIQKQIHETRMGLEDIGVGLAGITRRGDSIGLYDMMFRDLVPGTTTSFHDYFTEAIMYADKLGSFLTTQRRSTESESAEALYNYTISEEFVNFFMFHVRLPQFVSWVFENVSLQAQAGLSGIQTKLYERFALSVGLCIAFVSFPFVILYYGVYVRAQHIVRTFESLPKSAIRDVVSRDSGARMSEHGGAGVEAAGDDESDQAMILQGGQGAAKETPVIVLLFGLSFIPVLLCSLILMFTFDLKCPGLLDSLLRLRPVYRPALYMGAVFYHLTVAMMTEGLRVYYGDDQLFDKIIDGRGYERKEGLEGNMFNYTSQVMRAFSPPLQSMSERIATQVFGPLTPISIWVKDPTEREYYEDKVPFSKPNTTCPDFTDLERMVTSDMNEFFDGFCSLMYRWYHMEVNESEPYLFQQFMSPPHSTSSRPFDVVLTLMYLLSGWAQKYRFDPFQELLVQYAFDDLNAIDSQPTIFLVLLCILQICILGLLLVHLVTEVSRNSRSLQLLLFFNPSVILQNVNVSALLATGNVGSRQESSSFEESEKVLENIREGVVLCNPELVIEDLNDSFASLVELDKAWLRGKQIQTVIQPSLNEEVNVVEAFFLRIGLSIFDNGPPVTTEQLRIRSASGTEKQVFVTVSYLNEIGLAKGTSAAQISSIVLQFNDQTDQKHREDQLETQAAKVREMLERRMPGPIVSQLSEGTETLAYTVQSASIGCVSLELSAMPADAALEQTFRRWQSVFAIMDEFIGSFSTLVRVRTQGNIYVFGGGLFGTGQKPEKHAEEATRYGLKLITSAEEISRKGGFTVDFKIGLSIGGPLVAGVIGRNRPAFQLMGPPANLAEALMKTGEPNQLHVTRSVYELIYSHNFHVTERGEVKIQGGKTLRTYTVIP
jgi:PAS domain-containing protein